MAASRGSRPTTRYVASACSGRPSRGVCVLMTRRCVWAASTSIQAWLMTERQARCLLAEARPMPQHLGDLRFDAMLLRNRSARARELAAWSAVAETWDGAARLVTGE